MTTHYNQSQIQTLDLAQGGATVDLELVEQLPGVWSFKLQAEHFLKLYKKDMTRLRWDPDTTLFALFFGINDVYNSYRKTEDINVVYTNVMKVYADLVDQLHGAGARNFLIMNVPPMERAPLSSLGENVHTKPVLRGAVQNYNRRLERTITAAGNRLAGSTFFQFDTFSMWDKIFMDVSSNPLTAPYKELAHCCPDYFRTPGGMYAKVDTCKYPVDEFFWLDLLHPTFRIHNATAEAVVQRITNSCQKNDNPF